MPPFPRPAFLYEYHVALQLRALRAYRKNAPGRAIPPKAADRLLVATWNIANLGTQERTGEDHRLLAELLGWFDLVAIQEVNDNLAGLRAVRAQMPKRYRLMFSDAGGNDERFAFLFDERKVKPLEETGEVTVPARDLPAVKLPDIPARFVGFDRNPFLASFRFGVTDLVLANVHLYFGKSRPVGLPDDENGTPTTTPTPEPPPAAGIDRRVLEAYAVARWADARNRSEFAYTRNVIALGDFNLPVRAAGDRVYDALTRRGLLLPEHSTKVGGSNTRDNADYDQMAVLPGPVEDAIEQVGIFDFDGAVFQDLKAADLTRFHAYVQYHLSDHRPLWMALRF